MKAIRLIAAAVVAAMLFAPPAAHACPLCSEAIATATDGNAAEDVDNCPKAMNQSIYLMLGVPYLAFGVVGWMIYRGMRKNDEYRRRQGETGSDDRRPAGVVRA